MEMVMIELSMELAMGMSLAMAIALDMVDEHQLLNAVC